MRDVDLAALRAMVAELLTATATVQHAIRGTNAWGEAARVTTQTLTLPCAYGEQTRLVAGDAGIGPRSQQSLLVPHDAPVEVGDTVVSVTAPDGSPANVTGRVARVVRTPVVVLLELGGA